MNKRDLVSIIIPRHGEDLTQVLEAVNNSTYKHIEVLVIDKGLERSEQRNLGIMQAQGKYILILDADQVISPDLIRECVILMNCGVGGIYIPEIIKTRGLFAYIRNWERQFYNGTPIDVARFVRAKDCPLFDLEQKGTEDSDWDRRIKGIKLISKNPLYHFDNVGMLKWFSKKAYYSKSMKRFIERNPDDKILDWRWRCIKVFLERGKYKRFLSRPDLAVAVLGIIFLRGIIYLWKK
jgi:glycosyltransferase involved in cell wall biosynthesis